MVISPYLTRPLRTLEDALRDCGRSAADVGLAEPTTGRSAAAHHNRGEVLAQLLLSPTAGHGHSGTSAIETDARSHREPAPSRRRAA